MGLQTSCKEFINSWIHKNICCSVSSVYRSSNSTSAWTQPCLFFPAIPLYTTHTHTHTHCSNAGGGRGDPGWGEHSVRESAGQKVQWSERLWEEARAGGGAGQSGGSKASCLIALSDSTPALDGFFFTLPLKRTGCAFGVKPSRKC